MKIRHILLAAALLLGGGAADAQVRQSGTVTGGHPVIWLTTGVVQDEFYNNPNGGLNQLGVTSTSATASCISSGPVTAAYTQLCMGVVPGTGIQVTDTSYGGATHIPMNFVINGNASLTLNDTGALVNGSPVGTGGSVTQVAAGTGLTASPSPITVSGTLSLAAIATNRVLGNVSGISAAPTAITASDLSTLMALGTMSTQNASNVAITGGTISGAALTSDTIDSSIIGGTTPAAVRGTTVVASTSMTTPGLAVGSVTAQAGGISVASTFTANAPSMVGLAYTSGGLLNTWGSGANYSPFTITQEHSDGSAAKILFAITSSQVLQLGDQSTGYVTVTGATDPAIAAQSGNLSLSGASTKLALLGPSCTASGSTPQTCNGQRGIATTNSLSTAHNVAAAFVINNSSVTTSSLVMCTVNAYSGTITTNGVPVITQCVPGTGTITAQVFNADDTNALSGTVGIGFVVLN